MVFPITLSAHYFWMLLPKTKCLKCVAYQAQLNIIVSGWNRRSNNSNPQSHANYRYLPDSEKDESMRELHHSNCIDERRISRLRSKLDEIIELKGEQVEELMSADLEQIMRENDDHVEAQYGKHMFMHVLIA